MNIKSQRGLSLLGVLVVGALAAFVLIVGFRTVPVVNEYMSIKRIIGILADEADKGTPVLELRRSFAPAGTDSGGDGARDDGAILDADFELDTTRQPGFAQHGLRHDHAGRVTHFA